ncbi:MAG: hypothetical protein IKE30_06180 [Clostridia bacterium]|nr:hypothetical protein [Clostridia bacterium]
MNPIGRAAGEACAFFRGSLPRLMPMVYFNRKQDKCHEEICIFGEITANSASGIDPDARFPLFGRFFGTFRPFPPERISTTAAAVRFRFKPSPQARKRLHEIIIFPVNA